MIQIEEAYSPSIGIFFVVSGKLYAEPIKIRDAEDYGVMKTTSRDHYKMWDELGRVYKAFSRVPYDFYPRGRVVYDSNADQYIIYLDKCINNKIMVDKIISEFGLPYNKVRVDDTDLHYKCAKCNPRYIK